MVDIFRVKIRSYFGIIFYTLPAYYNEPLLELALVIIESPTPREMQDVELNL